MMDEQEVEDEDADMNSREEPQTMNDDAEENPHGLLAAAGLEDSDAEDEPVTYCLIGILTFKILLLPTHYPLVLPIIQLAIYWATTITSIFGQFWLVEIILLFLFKAEPSSTVSRRRQALSESDDDEPIIKQSNPVRENSVDMQESDGEIRDEKTYEDEASDEEK